MFDDLKKNREKFKISFSVSVGKLFYDFLSNKIKKNEAYGPKILNLLTLKETYTHTIFCKFRRSIIHQPLRFNYLSVRSKLLSRRSNQIIESFQRI